MDPQIIGSLITAVATVIVGLISALVALTATQWGRNLLSKLLDRPRRLAGSSSGHPSTGPTDDKARSDLENQLKASEQELEGALHNPQELKNKGWILYKLGRYEEALEAFEQALTQSPNNRGALHGEGSALNKLGKHQRALRAFEQLLSLRFNSTAGMGCTKLSVRA